MKQYMVVWHFEGNDKEQAAYNRKAAILQKEFSEVHNQFCEMANNGLIDSLNAEWDKMHPGEYDNDRYLAFFADGYALAVARKNLRSKHLTFTVGSEAQLIGHPKTGGQMYFTIIEK